MQLALAIANILGFDKIVNEPRYVLVLGLFRCIASFFSAAVIHMYHHGTRNLSPNPYFF